MHRPSNTHRRAPSRLNCRSTDSVCFATEHNTGYVNYAQPPHLTGDELDTIDERLRKRLFKLYADLRARYGHMLPGPWMERPSAFYAWALDLIGGIRGEA